MPNSKPWDRMIEWLTCRIDLVAKEHNWHQTEDNELYLWALDVENRHCKKEDAPWVSAHHAEPPIIITIGNVAQTAYSVNKVPDATGVDGLVQAGLGSSAALAHGNRQPARRSFNHTRKVFNPIQVLKEWISGRIWYAAAGGCKENWCDALTHWINRVWETKEPEKQPPTALALGYIMHAACNYTDVANVTSTHGEEQCDWHGKFFSFIDLRTEPLDPKQNETAEKDIKEFSTWLRTK